MVEFKDLTCFNFMSNVLARLFFIGHLIGLIIYTCSTIENAIATYFAIPMPFFIVADMIYVLKCRKGQCYKWVCPSAFLYIVGVALALVPLKLHQLKSIQKHNLNCSAEAEPDHHEIHLGEIFMSIPVGKTEMVEILEQTTYLVLIISRWVLPKERVHSDRALHILFLLVAVVSDIMELFLLFKEPKVIATEHVQIVVIAVWGWSLLQFVFVVSDTRGGDTRGGETQEDDDQGGCCGSYTSDIIGLVATLILMDLPFLVVRLYVSITLHVVNHRIVFYMAKNMFVAGVAFYRLVSALYVRFNE